MPRKRLRSTPWQDEFYVRIGRKLRRWRGIREMPQTTLAAALEISRPALANIEAGRQRVTVDLIWRASIVLDAPLPMLLPVLRSSGSPKR